MLKSFRNASKSKLGTAVAIIFLVLILAGFAAGDLSQFRSAGGANSPTLASVGDEEVDTRDFQTVAQRMLNNVRAQQPDATYADLGPQLPALLDTIIDEKALAVFAKENGITPSKRMIDALIATLPAAQGPDGRFSQGAYAAFLQQSRLTDADVRRVFADQANQQLLLAPAVATPRSPNKIARAYAAMLLEQRSGIVAILPVTAFEAGLNPTARDLQGFYARNKAQFMVPEQRVLSIGKIDPASVGVAAPSEADIDALLKTNAAQFGGGESRSIRQLVLSDEGAANRVAAAAKAGKSLADAAVAGGKAAGDVATVDLSEARYADAVGKAAAKAVFALPSGGVAGPIKSDLGWVVAKVEKITAGKSEAQIRAEARTALAAQQSSEKLNELAGKFDDRIADGASMSEAAKALGIALVQTPLVTADGRVLKDPSYKVDPALAPAIAAGFQLERGEDPVVESNAAKDGFLIVGVERIVASAPAPLAEVADDLRRGWIAEQANARAAAAASKLVALAKSGKPLAEAAKALGVTGVTTSPMMARRLDLAKADPVALPALRMLFSLPIKGSGLVRDPTGRGFAVVTATGSKAGNALSDPALIQQARMGQQQAMGRELGTQLLGAIRAKVGVERNEAAISKTLGDLVSAGQ